LDGDEASFGLGRGRRRHGVQSTLLRRAVNSNGVRSFISIEIPRPIREQIVGVAEPLRSTRGKINWCKPNNLHITLKFLGTCTRGRLESISKKLAQIAARHAPFKIGFGGVGVFPTPVAPRVIWLGITEGKEELTALVADVEASMEAIGFKRETRRYRPHITLGRIKYLTSKDELNKAIAEFPEVSIDPVVADHIFLMRSQLHPKGAIYTIIERLCFSGPKPS